MTQQYIVGEISKSWIAGRSANGDPTALATLFERLIESVVARGYHLHSWQVHRVMTQLDELNETIIAVFQLDDTTAE